MRQYLFLHSLLLAYMLIRGETRSQSQIPGSPQDGATVGLLLHNEKCVNDSTQSTTKAATEKASKEFISVQSSATNQPTTDSIADITGQPFTDVQSYITNQPTLTTNHSGLYLYEASARGDLASVNKVLEVGGTNLSWENPDEQRATPLHAAAQFNHSDVVTALLNAGAEKDPQDDRGRTPLYYASRDGSIDAATILIARGASFDIPDQSYDKWGATPLHAAAEFNHSDVLAALLNAGGEKDRQDDVGRTPLHYASEYGSIDAVNVLIARGASVDIHSRIHGEIALHTAAEHNHPAIVTILIDAGSAINQHDNSRQTPLYYASLEGSIDALTVLIARGASVDIPNKWGYTALHVAAGRNRPATVSALIDAGADRDRQDDDGRTPLYTALFYFFRPSYYDSIAAVNILIARGADVNTPRNDGTTPVAWASYVDNLPAVEALVAANADVNIPNEDGITALHLVAANADVNIPNMPGFEALYQAALNLANNTNSLAIASVLLHGGASASAQDNQGRTPADVAQEKGQQELADIISMHGLKSQIWDILHMSGR